MPDPVVEPVTEPVVDPAALAVDPAAPPAEPVVADPADPPKDLPKDAVKDVSKDAPKDPPASDWRDKMAGGDEKFRKRLDRFTDESSFAKSYLALEGKLKSGEYTKALPENATDEEIATWRKENNLPEKHEGYIESLELPKGLVLGEEDKPVAELFAQRAHDLNWTPKQFNEAVSWYYENQEAQKALQAEADDAYKQTAEDELRSVWEGADYRRNVTAANNLMATWPDGLAEAVQSARTVDGNILGNHPAFTQVMAQLALDINPAASITPTGTSDPSKTAQSRLDEIREARKADPDAYDQNKKLQAEELELIQIMEKVNSRK